MDDAAGDGVAARTVALKYASSIVMGAHGELYVSDQPRVRFITPEGILRTLAGTGPSVAAGSLATASFGYVSSMAMHPDGTLVIVDQTHQRIVKVEPALPGFTGAVLRTMCSLPKENTWPRWTRGPAQRCGRSPMTARVCWWPFRMPTET